MKEHIRRIKNDETHVHYLGKRIQNELIQILSNAIKEKILTSARKAKYFSIILDCTPDVSHLEQMTMIIRFVDTVPSGTGKTQSSHSFADEIEVNHMFVKDHFLGFVPLNETTGECFN